MHASTELRVRLSDATASATPVLTFADPDGMAFALLESPALRRFQPGPTATIPAEHAIRGFGGVTLGVNERKARLPS